MQSKQCIVTIDCRSIRDFASFHSVFAAAFAFPAFYGRNMDAWLDCMSTLDTDFSGFRIELGQVVILKLEHAKSLQSHAPEVWHELIECSAFVNQRRTENGQSAIIELSWASGPLQPLRNS
jgi:RNAse (barnase) inhibitor barstar